MVAAPAAASRRTCQLAPDDVERVIAIDRAFSGRARRHFFERRFAAAKARPEDFIHIGVHRGGALRGFLIARILRGEFGRDDAVAVLDAIGVEPQSQKSGIGRTLLTDLIETLEQMGVRTLQSQAEWTNNDLVRFFAGSRFALAPRWTLERAVNDPLEESGETE